MNKLLKLLFISAFFNALCWMILIPIWQYPDEQAHFAQVQNVAELGKVRTVGNDTSYEIALSEKILGTDRNGFGNNKYTYHPEYNIPYSENSTGLFEKELSNLLRESRTDLVKREATLNPPLYYLLGSFAYRLTFDGSLFDRIFAVRFLSALIFLATIFLAFNIGKIIFRKDKFLPIILTLLISFMPMLVFSSTGILPDVLTNLLFTLVVFISLLIIKNGPKFKNLVFVLSVIIAGSLTRQQFLISIPIILLAIGMRAFLEHKIKQIWFFLSFIVLVVLLSTVVPSFWYIKDLSLPEVGQVNLNLLFSENFSAYLKVFSIETYNQTFAWYWGVYRWLSLTLPPFSYQILKTAVLFCTLGIVVRITKNILQKKIKKDLYLYFLMMSSLIYISVIIIWDYYFRSKHGFSFGIQGRYFFPLVVAHISILLIGLQQISELILKKYAVFGVFLLAVLMIIFNDLSLFHITASYYDTSSLNNFTTQASQYKPFLFKGSKIVVMLSLSVAFQLLLIVTLTKHAIKKTEKNF